MGEFYERFPRLAAYIASLPNGLDSFPECQAKASLVHFALRKLAVNFPRHPLPERIRTHLDSTEIVSSWVNEVEYMAVTLALWDGHRLTDDQACDVWYDVTHALRTSKLYGLLLGFLSPGRLLKGAPMAWKQFHQGTSLKIVDETSEGCFLELIHPPGVYSPLMLRAYASVFQGTVERTELPLSMRDLAPSSKPGCARYVIRF